MLKLPGMQKIGLVLSGGGARGLAHTGVLRALNELKIPIAAISGVSAGAMMGACYAAGMKPEAIRNFAVNVKLFEFSSFAFSKKGIFNTDSLRKALTDFLPVRTFEELNMPLTITATDFSHMRSIRFTSGDLIEPLLASSAIPVVFNPVMINRVPMVDGGLLDNFPVETLRDSCDKIIGVHVNPIHTLERDYGIPSIIDRSFHMAIAQRIAEKSQLCDLFIEPHALYKYGLFDTKKSKEISEIGYRSAMQHKEQLLAMCQ